MADRPNILVLLCDQLSAKAVGAYGNPHVRTPTMDSLAARGTRFERAYTPCPLCQPARPSIWTSRLPHETGVTSNSPHEPVPESIPTLGEIFAEAGYETVHFGKTHDAASLRGFRIEPQDTLPVEDPHYFINPDTTHDRYTTVKSVEYLGGEHKRPFLMIADLVNPHNICGWIGEHRGPHTDTPIPDPLPPLPENFEIADLARRPRAVQHLCCAHRRLAHASRWNETNYRHYLAAYYHYTKRVDNEMRLILEALEASGDADSTVVVFLADHGEGMAAHRMVTKSASFYEEVTRVPLVVAGPGIAGGGRAAEEPLVSLLDVLPTLCDVAGLEAPEGIRGRSLVPWLRGERTEDRHPYVTSQWETEFGFVVTPCRMLRSKRYKYTRYAEDGGEELYDLEADPGETRTLVDDPAHAAALEEHRRLLERHLEATGDDFLDREARVDPRWRSHPIGYPNHPEPTFNAIEVGRKESEGQRA